MLAVFVIVIVNENFTGCRCNELTVLQLIRGFHFYRLSKFVLLNLKRAVVANIMDWSVNVTCLITMSQTCCGYGKEPNTWTAHLVNMMLVLPQTSDFGKTACLRPVCLHAYKVAQFLLDASLVEDWFALDTYVLHAVIRCMCIVCLCLSASWCYEAVKCWPWLLT